MRWITKNIWMILAIMKSRYTRKIFPFAPGIAWNVQNGKFIVPEIDQETWNEALDGRDAVVLAHSGLLESFFSLSIVEALAHVETSKRLFWAGNEHFQSLVSSHGRAQFLKMPDVCSRYPVPLFMDKRRAYFNCLNNYRFEKSYYGTHMRHDSTPVCKQLFRNSLLSWDTRYVPKLTTGGVGFDAWKKMARFHDNKKHILIIPGRTGCSRHPTNCLGWGSRELREFTAMLHRFDMEVVLCTGSRTTVYDAPYVQAPRTLGIILSLIPRASMVLADDIDFLFIALAMSKAAIVAPQKCSENEFDLYKNAEFLEAENVIFTTETPTPAEIYTICEGIS